MTQEPHIKQDSEEGTFEEDVYTEEGREELLEEDEIDEIEEGLAEGFEHGDRKVKCQECGKLLVDDKFVEQNYDDDTYRFCSDTCAEQYSKKRKIV